MLLRDMKLLNYENIKNNLLAPCQFNPKNKIKSVLTIILRFEFFNIAIDLWEPPKDNQSLSHLWELA